MDWRIKGNSQSAEEYRTEHLHRMVQSLCLSVAVLCHWSQINNSLTALWLLISLIIYQLLIFMLPQPLKAHQIVYFPKLIRFADGVIVGLCIALINYDSSLSIVITLGLIIRHIASPIKSLICAFLGLLMGILLNKIFNLPQIVLTESYRALLLLIIIAFIVVCALKKHIFYSNLSSEFKVLSNYINELKLRNFRLSKYLSPSLRKGIMAGKNVQVDAQEKPLTIFFSDMQGFSKMTEILSPEQLTRVVNSYLTEMSEIAFRFGGTLDKVIGDSLMVFFGDPQSRGEENDAAACVCMALAMRDAMETLKKRWRADGITHPPSLRMGINSGVCKVGNFGTENCLEYTALGKAVNMASQLESAAKINEIIVSQATYNLVKDLVHCEQRKPVKIKGFVNPLPVYSAVKLAENN